jgi:hypothetical protein
MYDLLKTVLSCYIYNQFVSCRKASEIYFFLKVCEALSNMESFSDSGYDCWLSQIRKMEKLFCVPSFFTFCKTQHSTLKKQAKSIFDRFWLDEINLVKSDNLGVNCNK